MGGSVCLLPNFVQPELRQCGGRVSSGRTDVMLLRAHRSPLLLTVTCMCFSGALLWSYQQEDVSEG